MNMTYRMSHRQLALGHRQASRSHECKVRREKMRRRFHHVWNLLQVKATQSHFRQGV